MAGAFLPEHNGISAHLQLLENNVDSSAGAENIEVRIGALPTARQSQLGSAQCEPLAPRCSSSIACRSIRAMLAKLPAVTLDIPPSNPATKTRRAQARLSITNPTPPLLNLARRAL